VSSTEIPRLFGVLTNRPARTFAMTPRAPWRRFVFLSSRARDYSYAGERRGKQSAPMIYEFEGCTLDAATQEFRRDDELVAVEPQVFAVLEYLLSNPDRVVTKIELLDEVWGDRFVSEAALTSRIKLARQACGDSGRAQRVIKTVHGRGYRIVAAINQRGGAGLNVAATPIGPGAAGRELELAALTEATSAASGGEQTTVFVTGPAGSGKSTLVADFLERNDDHDDFLVIRGRCHRSRSGPEPYFGLLDALGALAAVEPDLVRDTFERVAPSWLVQLPALVDDDTAARLERRLLGGARQRMLREGAEAFTALARLQPTLLVLEDLHFADDCTLDVLELISSRHDAVPLLVVATTRPGAESVDGLTAELALDGSARTIPLGPLDRDAIGLLVSDRYPNQSVEPQLIELVHNRCDGNPLFAHEILTAWHDAEMIAADDRTVAVNAGQAELLATIPVGLVPLIERALDALDPDELSILEAAAVVGFEFDAGCVAAGLDRRLPETEVSLAVMARRPDHISATGATTWAQGTASTSYAFSHQLYRDVIHDRIAAGRKVELHRRVGLSLEAGHQGTGDERAATLADHFVAAGDGARAARYLRQVGAQAMARQAHGHATDVLAEALGECERLPTGTERDTLEMVIRLSLGQACVGVSGWTADIVSEHYQRALELAEKLGAPEEAANARYGLATISEINGNYERTEQLLTPLIAADNHGLEMEAHELVACSTFNQGAFERSEANSGAVLSTWSEDTTSEVMARVAEHPATSCNSWMSLSNWFLGRSDDSLRRAENAVRLGERHRYALAMATQQRAMLHQFRNEPRECLDWSDRTRNLGRGLVSRVRTIQADLMTGWSNAVGDSADHDIAAMADALDSLRSSGSRLNEPYYVTLYADALIHQREPAKGVRILDEADAAIEDTTRSYFHRSEIRRIRARAILDLDESDARDQAREMLDESLRLAWEMGSPALALRTTCDRFEFERGEGDAEPWRNPLAELLARYDGQTPPPDVTRAQSLLVS